MFTLHFAQKSATLHLLIFSAVMDVVGASPNQNGKEGRKEMESSKQCSAARDVSCSFVLYKLSKVKVSTGGRARAARAG